MSLLTDLQILLNATSSPESVSGVTPCGRPDGPMIDLFGQEVARANLSARQAAERGSLTSGTYGRLGSISSSSAALQQYLVNRLATRCATDGSTLFNLTWKELVTPAGRSISLLRASARRTSDNDFGSWPTPMAASPSTEHYNEAGNCDSSRKTVTLAAWPSPVKGNGDGGHQMGRASATGRTPEGGKVSVTLNGVEKFASWNKPRATDGTKDGPHQANGALSADVNFASWPTPRVGNNGGYGKAERGARSSNCRIEDVVQLCGPARLTASGEMLTGSDARMESGGQLNPALSRWLMGLPSAWDREAPLKESPAPKCSAATETRSTRKRRELSSPPTSKPRNLFD